MDHNENQYLCIECAIQNKMLKLIKNNKLYQ